MASDGPGFLDPFASIFQEVGLQVWAAMQGFFQAILNLNTFVQHLLSQDHTTSPLLYPYVVSGP